MDRRQHEQRIAQNLDLNNLLGEELQKRVQAGKEYVRQYEARQDVWWEKAKADADALTGLTDDHKTGGRS